MVLDHVFPYDIRVEAVSPLDSMGDVKTVGELEGLKKEDENSYGGDPIDVIIPVD